MNELLARHLTASQLILDVMVLCLIIGAIDYYRGNKWGLGSRFEEGFGAFTSLLLTMAGIIALVPLIEKLLTPYVVPLYAMVGADPAIFAGTVLANDMGAFQLAHAFARSKEAGDFGGMLLGSIMGVNIVFNIPVALRMIEKHDRQYMARGMLFGFIMLPIGGLCGGLAAGYPLGFVLLQIIPVSLVSGVIALLFWLIPNLLVKGFILFGKFVALIALAGTVIAIAAELTGITTAPLLDSIGVGLKVVGSIVIVLPGAYVLVTLLSRGLGKLFLKAGRKLGINETAVLGLVSSLANCIPTFAMVKDMDAKGKVLNFAFLTAGAFAFGDHLAFCGAVAPQLIVPMLTAKLTAAFAAVVLVLVYYALRKR